MLFLIFHLGGDRYALEANRVVELLPLVSPKQIPHAPDGVAGVFDYHGTPVPLVDLAELAFGQPSQKWMSTRIIVVNCANTTGERQVLGLVAERATETLRANDDEFGPAGILTKGAPYLGAVKTDDLGMIQRVDVDKLLPESIRSQLAVAHTGPGQ